MVGDHKLIQFIPIHAVGAVMLKNAVQDDLGKLGQGQTGVQTVI